MSVSILLFATATLAAAQDDSRWEHQSESQDVLLRDFVELWNDSEFDTGWVPASSPLQVRSRSSPRRCRCRDGRGGAHGVARGAHRRDRPVPDTGEIIVDAALEAVTNIKFDVDIYSWESEIDRRGIDVEGEAFFSPFLLQGDVPEVVEVLFEGDTNELLNWSFGFTGVSAGITVDLGPDMTTFTGGNWYIDENGSTQLGRGLGGSARRGLSGGQRRIHWQLGVISIVLNPVFEVCVDLVGYWDLVDLDIPIPLASDDFDQFFPPPTSCSLCR